MILIALIVIQAHIVQIADIIRIESGVFVVVCRDDLNTAVAQASIDGVQLCIGNVDVLQFDLDVVLGNRTLCGCLDKQVSYIGIELATGALRLFRHRISLHST